MNNLSVDNTLNGLILFATVNVFVIAFFLLFNSIQTIWLQRIITCGTICEFYAVFIVVIVLIQIEICWIEKKY